MKAFSTVVEAETTPKAISELETALAASAPRADAVFAFYGCSHDASALQQFLAERFPDAAIIGGSSSGGVMDSSSVYGPSSVGLLLLDDPDGEYGAASTVLGETPADAAETALIAALDDAGCPGELPELIWIYQAPGREEAVIEGLRRVVGDRCPIVGGSAADNDVSGGWTQIGPDGSLSDGVTVAVLFPSRGVRFAFQGGYAPAGPNGTVTKIGSGEAALGQSSRTIREIDGEPAAQVFQRWTGRVGDALDGGGVVLAETATTPLAVEAGTVDGVSQYLLIHPESVTPEGALTTFASVEAGEVLHCMRGEPSILIERAGRVAAQAARELEDAPAAALLVFCTGCRIAVQDQIAAAPASIRAALGDAPALCCFTFGEQGSLLGRNAHGNLMISAVVFGT